MTAAAALCGFFYHKVLARSGKLAKFPHPLMHRRAPRPSVLTPLLLLVSAVLALQVHGQTVLSGTYTGSSISGDVSIATSTSATFTGGAGFSGANATFGNSATLYWQQNGTLAGKSITLGTTGTAYINVGNSNSLTFDNATTVTGGVYIYGNTGSTINNQGTITHNTGSGYLYAPTLTNSGAITANSGTTFFVGSSSSGYNTTNTSTGTITANGANLYLDGNVINQGTLTAQNGGALYFRYNNTTGNLGTVVIGSGGGHAYLNGTLDNTSATLNAPTGGSYELYGGTINNGTIATGALTFTGSGGTLSNASYTGDLTLPSSTSVTFTGGTSFTGANATLGNYAELYWNQNGTLTGKTITLGTTGDAYINVGNSNSLTLGSGTAVTGDVYIYGNTGSTITNQGAITQTTGTGYLYAPTLTNSGAITASSGTTLFVGSTSAGYNTTNTSTGTITANGANLYLDGNVINQGTLTAQNGGALYFRGNTTTGNLGTVVIGSGGGHAYLNGTLDNTSATLNAPSGGSYELYGGTINNGTIATGALTFTGSGGTLSNVSYTGDLTLPSSTSVTFTNGTSFTGANATLGNYAELYWNQNGTLTGKTITLGTTGDAYIDVGSTYSLTLSSTTTVSGGVYLYGNSASSITNQGAINQTTGTGYIYAPTFTNSGAITASGGSNLYVGYYSGEAITNASGGTITADGTNTGIYLEGLVNQGTLTAQNGGALHFEGNNVTADLGTVVLGTGGGHAYLNGTLDNTSATLTAPTGGSYELYGGTVKNGTIAAGALTFTNYNGTLDGASLTGDLTLPASTSATFTNGAGFTGANATLGNYAYLYWNQNGTLTGKTITLGTTADAYINVGNSNSLTLDSATTVTGGVYLYGNSAASITNQGTINQTTGYGYLYAPTFTNQGSITTSAGTNLYVGYYSGYTTTNASGGTIMADGASANLYLYGVTNQGTLTARNGGALYFQGNNTTASLGTVQIGTGGGHAYLNGTLDNTSATLNAPAGGSYELYNGTINNGTIATGALTFTSSGGTLSNASYTGDLTLPASTSVTFTNGAGFTGANATLGNYAYLYWNQNGALTGKTITFGTTTDAYIDVGTNNSLTLGSGTAATGSVYIYGNSGSSITNQGAINHTTGTGYLYAPTFTNQGSITTGAGASLYVGNYYGYTATNASGGTMAADGASANLYLYGVTNQGTLTARNGGALTFQGNNTTASLGTVQIGTGGGHAYLNGTLDNTSATLTAPAGGSYELYGGTVKNGTIATGALTFTNYNGTLDGASIAGDLTLPASSYATFINGAGFTGANATLGNYSDLYWNESGTLSGKALSFGTGAYLSVGANSLTLDGATTATGDVTIYSGYTGASITNQGTITHTTGTGYLYAPTFTNQGSITVGTGAGLYLGYYSGYTVANTAGASINLTGGSIYLGSPLTNAGLINVQSGTFYTNGYLTNGTTGTLGGSGTIYGNLLVAGGIISPGNSIGTLTFSSGGFALSNPATLAIDLSGASSDLLAFSYPTGVVDIGSGLLTLNLNLLGPPTATTYNLISITGGSGFTGYFNGLPASGDIVSASYLGTSYDFTIQYLANGVALDFTPVPEPGTCALLAGGLLLLAGLRFRRRVVAGR